MALCGAPPLLSDGTPHGTTVGLAVLIYPYKQTSDLRVFDSSDFCFKSGNLFRYILNNFAPHLLLVVVGHRRGLPIMPCHARSRSSQNKDRKTSSYFKKRSNERITAGNLTSQRTSEHSFVGTTGDTNNTHTHRARAPCIIRGPRPRSFF